MSRKSSNFLDYDIQEDIDPKTKFNSVVSATISTIMCLAAKCPVPKSNVETTKLFLSTITDDNGETPRNAKAVLAILNGYAGPYDSHGHKEKKSLPEKILQDKSAEEKEKLCIEYDSILKGSQSSSQIVPKESHHQTLESHPVAKRISKGAGKRSEKEPKKFMKTLSSKMSSTKSLIGASSRVKKLLSNAHHHTSTFANTFAPNFWAITSRRQTVNVSLPDVSPS